MNLEEIKETDTWSLYDHSVSYCRMLGMFDDTDKNYRMYNGDQWYGLKIKGIEKIQYNFIKPIVRYKTGIIMTNLYAINYSSENLNQEYRKQAEELCKLLNKKASNIWENDYLDFRLRTILKDAAINDEGILYSFYDKKEKQIHNDILNKNDIYFGNENNSDVQQQPYILLKQRKSVPEIQLLAKMNNISDSEIQYIVGDLENSEEAGETAKYEKDNMCTLITKLYRKDGKIYFSQSTRYLDIVKETNTGLKYYPVAHLLWEEKKGSARGEGEVRYLIPNQIETNKTAMRRALTVKNTAYPQKVANISKIANPSSLDEVGGIIKVQNGQAVDDVNKILANINPAQMSSDVEKLQQELISETRELAGAGDIATGQINPESASGRAILAVQQASQQPLTEQQANTKRFIEDIARIWLDMLTVYNPNGLDLEEEIEDPISGEKNVQIVHVPQVTLRELQANVKVDVTPRGSFDKYAQEASMENLLTNGYFSSQKISELKLYVKTLDDDSVMPKQKLLKVIEEYENEQQKIATMNVQAQMMKQRANQFLMGDSDLQSEQLLEIANQQDSQEDQLSEEIPM